MERISLVSGVHCTTVDTAVNRGVNDMLSTIADAVYVHTRANMQWQIIQILTVVNKEEDIVVNTGANTVVQ